MKIIIITALTALLFGSLSVFTFKNYKKVAPSTKVQLNERVMDLEMSK